jgi:hypothetical protein
MLLDNIISLNVGSCIQLIKKLLSFKKQTHCYCYNCGDICFL